MSDRPPPQKTPLQIARDNLTHWARRCRELESQLDDALAERVKASEELDGLEKV